MLMIHKRIRNQIENLCFLSVIMIRQADRQCVTQHHLWPGCVAIYYNLLWSLVILTDSDQHKGDTLGHLSSHEVIISGRGGREAGQSGEGDREEGAGRVRAMFGSDNRVR